MRVLLLTCVCLGAFWNVSSSVRADDSDSQYVEVLQAEGIEPDADSIRDYLQSLHPSPEADAKIAELIRQLSHDDFFQREAAMEELLRMPVRSPERLQEATESADPETRWRAQRVLEIGRPKADRVLYAVLTVVAGKELPGLAEPILEATTFCDQPYLRRQARRALVATVEPSDEPLLRSRIAEGSQDEAVASVFALESLLVDGADDDLRRLLERSDDEIRLAAARGLVNHGNRDGLPALVALLESQDRSVRIRSANVLRAVTGERFGFTAYEKDDERQAAVTRWQSWINGDGRTAKLVVPVDETAIHHGRTLAVNYTKRKVFELDEQGRVIWSKTGVTTPYGCQGLPNGHRLVASYSLRTIYEYDASGNLVWQKKGLPSAPYCVQRLENGNTLVACSNSVLYELDRSGKVVWQEKVSRNPKDAKRLPNGNTLVALYSTNKVVEIDPKGKTVWEVKVNRPYSAQRLDNGNTLVAEYSGRRILEYDRDGKIVWSRKWHTSVYRAQRLPNGNTLVVDRTGLREIDPSGKAIWQRAEAGLRDAHRF